MICVKFLKVSYQISRTIFLKIRRNMHASCSYFETLVLKMPNFVNIVIQKYPLFFVHVLKSC